MAQPERLVFLDTETTGLDPKLGHRIIEVGAVEAVGRRLTGNDFHRYINPNRDIDPGAVAVHGITAEFLVGKPKFAEVAKDLAAFLENATVVIHNAAFDLAFLEAEFSLIRMKASVIESRKDVVDSLALARAKFPGKRNSLDALCERFGIDNSSRNLHGALLDARLLGEVYFALTREQQSITIENESGSQFNAAANAEAIQLTADAAAEMLSVDLPLDLVAAHRAYMFGDKAEAIENAGKFW
jgi:DNA polymerase III subunit epsilon